MLPATKPGAGPDGVLSCSLKGLSSACSRLLFCPAADLCSACELAGLLRLSSTARGLGWQGCRVGREALSGLWDRGMAAEGSLCSWDEGSAFALQDGLLGWGG